MIQVVNVADLINPDTGKTWRQENAERQHNIPIGALVELKGDEYNNKREGVRLYVVSHDRDCDMTPLYSMSADRTDTVCHREGFANWSWVHGWPENALTVIRLPDSSVGEVNNEPR